MTKNSEMLVLSKSKALIEHTILMTDSASRYPKKARFTLVNRMQNLAFDIFVSLLNANEIEIKNRRNLQVKALGDLKVLLYLIELSKKLGYIDGKQCSAWSKKALDVKFLTAAWLKKSL